MEMRILNDPFTSVMADPSARGFSLGLENLASASVESK